MESIQITKYKCGICGTLYANQTDALKCESRPVSHDDVDVGDTVRILTGDGTGESVKVESKSIASMDWGHYQAGRYWHTPIVSGRVIDSWGSHSLTFDAREKI